MVCWRSWDIGRSRCINFRVLKGVGIVRGNPGSWCLELRIMDVLGFLRKVYRDIAIG